MTTFGSSSAFSISIECISPVEIPRIWGHLQMTIGGHEMGEWSETTSLWTAHGMLSRTHRFSDGRRVCLELFDLPFRELLRLVYGVLTGRCERPEAMSLDIDFGAFEFLPHIDVFYDRFAVVVSSGVTDRFVFGRGSPFDDQAEALDFHIEAGAMDEAIRGLYEHMEREFGDAIDRYEATK